MRQQHRQASTAGFSVAARQNAAMEVESHQRLDQLIGNNNTGRSGGQARIANGARTVRPAAPTRPENHSPAPATSFSPSAMNLPVQRERFVSFRCRKVSSRGSSSELRKFERQCGSTKSCGVDTAHQNLAISPCYILGNSRWIGRWAVPTLREFADSVFVLGGPN